MKLIDGRPHRLYSIIKTALPPAMERQLAVLGMTTASPIQIIRRKKNGAMIIRTRGSRFAIGAGITANIEIRTENSPLDRGKA